jgi:predicted phosphodiesterase
MSSDQRILVMGDNHGDVESLDQVVAETDGEAFDFIVHVGDLTNAVFDGVEAGVEQLQAVESRLDTLANRADGGLLYIYGNRDGIPGSGYINQRHELDVGTRIPPDDVAVVRDQRFIQNPELAAEDDILVTHGERASLLDHFDGRAYFSGHEHTGRYKNRCLNSAFLYRTDDHQAEPLIGGYFVVTVTDEPPFDVDFRNLDRLQQIICERHYERGVQFAPDYHECQFCYDGEHQFLLEMAQSAFYGLTQQRDRPAVTDEGLVTYAVNLLENTPQGFEQKLTQYVSELGSAPLDPFERDDDGLITTRSS